VRTPILLYAIALAVRGLLIGVHPDPAYPDSAYYVEVARSIAAGRGLTVDFVWIFAEVGNRIPAAPALPIPSNGHWLPLASFVQVPFIVALGPTALASALPLALIGSLAAPLTWLIARDAGARPAVASGAGLLSAAPAAGTMFMAQPENLAILQPLVAATLWLVARGLKGQGAAFAAAGLLAGLAALARNDGVLLAGTVGLVWLGDRARWWRRRSGARAWAQGPIRHPVPLWAGAGAAALFLAVIGPWWARQQAVFGSISPTASSGAALWIRSIDEWNSITAQPSLDRFLAQGVGPIVASRVDGLASALAIFAVVVLAVVLVVPLVVGIVARRRSIDFVPWLVYAPVVFLAAAIIYPAHIPGGAFIHSAIGLVPHAYILVLEGTAALAASLGVVLSRRGGRPVRDGVGDRLFIGASVAFAAAAGIVYGGPVADRWDAIGEPRAALAADLDRRGVPRDDRLLSLDAASLKYWTGRPGVVTTNDPIDTIEAVARAYAVRWLVLEDSDPNGRGPVPALAPVLAGGARPDWIGPPAFTVPNGAAGGPALALLPVCTSPGDGRCVP
jgi:hypothetical protein